MLLILLILANFKFALCYNSTSSINNDQDWDNATWVLTSSFIIITMQSGFGLLESGMVSLKNSTHIMIKNITDIIFGGITFWLIGYSIIFGTNSNGFISFEEFFSKEDSDSGWLFANFFFQFSFSTTATTIVSGCLAERTKFEAYIIFSLLNTFIYSLPAHWIWNDNGWLKSLGVLDFAGAGPVHLSGGLTGLVGTLILGPRINRNIKPSSYVNALLGCFMLWWGWLGFNCGSTLGITEYKWLYAGKAAVTTVISSIGGGIFGIIYSMILNKKKILIDTVINSILGSLVSITASCIYVSTPESFFIGIIGSLISIKSNDYIKYLNIDDPVGAIGVHACSAIWGILTPGLFAKKTQTLNINNGLFYGGGFYLLGIQVLEIISISSWSLVISYIFFKFIDIILGLRLTEEEESLGADHLYHYDELETEVQVIENSNLTSNLNESDINSNESDINSNESDINSNESDINSNENFDKNNISINIKEVNNINECLNQQNELPNMINSDN